MIERGLHFPTITYTRRVPEPDALNQALLEGIRHHRRQDPVGYRVSNLGGWHSHNRLDEDPAFAPIVEIIRETCTEVERDLGYGYPLELTSLWAIINKPGDSNEAHVHAGALWSGVYYVATPHDGGDLKLIDPRTVNRMQTVYFAPGERPDFCRKRVMIRPEPGLLVLFPAWLYHSVTPNRSEHDRIILSFNLRQKQQP